MGIGRPTVTFNNNLGLTKSDLVDQMGVGRPNGNWSLRVLQRIVGTTKWELVDQMGIG